MPELKELPDGWTPDPITLEFIAVMATQELRKRGDRHGVLARGSDRHENVGAMQVLAGIANFCVQAIKAVEDGTFHEMVEIRKDSQLVTPTGEVAGAVQ